MLSLSLCPAQERARDEPWLLVNSRLVVREEPGYVQSKSVTCPALAAPVEAELAANNPWSIPERRKEGKKESTEAQELVWSRSPRTILPAFGVCCQSSLCSTVPWHPIVQAVLGTLLSLQEPIKASMSV